MRRLLQEREEGAKTQLLALVDVEAIAGASPDMLDHLPADRRQQLVEDVLARYGVVVEGALGNARALRDPGDRRLLVSQFADQLGSRAKKRLADQHAALVARAPFAPVTAAHGHTDK